MQPKPEHFSASYAEAFKDRQVVEVYQHRSPYPTEVFDILAGLIVDKPRVVLDVGAGTGDIARHLVEFVGRVDAVDPSQVMIGQGQQLSNGDHPHLCWILGKVEEVSLAPPYALITAGSSIHWTEWEIAFPLFCSLLTSNGFLAVIHRRTQPMPWDDELRELKMRFSTHRDRKWPNTIAELEVRGFFHKRGEKETAPVPYFQSVDDFIAGQHSRSSLSRPRMGEQQATEFDQQVRSLLLRYHSDGILPLHAVGTVTWGMPERGLQ